MPTPMLSGTASTSVTKEDTTVPQMKGSAPYTSNTGSHTVPVTNAQP